MVYANGDYYEGEWEAGLRQGEGVLVYANGNVYEGQWEGDNKEGKGRFSHASGVIQVFSGLPTSNSTLSRMAFGCLTASNAQSSHTEGPAKVILTLISFPLWTSKTLAISLYLDCR